ncbi:MAG TPA: BON domain-containing protein [Gemmatimonadaceae bacterium]|nr:BON domain-containing protein [Gemmatimonadaceae bacterium]
MKPFRYRDEEPLSQSLAYVIGGALAGFAAGVLVAHRMGGVAGITSRVRERFGGTTAEEFEDEAGYETDEFDAEFDEIGIGAESPGENAEELEQRVLHAYENDPVLSERPVDIGAISDGIVELTGWVNSEEEAAHAVTLARGVPGVDTVVNRLAVRPREDQLNDRAERYANGDPVLTESHWEGQNVGTGRRRQGNSSEPDRHADPRPALAERWMREDTAIAEAAEDIAGRTPPEPRQPRSKRGGRTDGSPVGPSGVPKGDHVAEPTANRSENPPANSTRAD